MKKNFINYYYVTILLSYLIYNFALFNIKIGGFIYQFFMIVVIITNIILLFKNQKEIKFKGIYIAIYFFTFIFGKNIFQILFSLSNIVTLCIIGNNSKNVFLKIITPIFCTLLIIIFHFLFVILGTAEKGRMGIDEYQHYYCDNNYEAYAYSAGAFDKFHYNAGKHYKIIDDKVLYVFYSKQKEVSYEEYVNIIKEYNGKIADDRYIDYKMLIN